MTAADAYEELEAAVWRTDPGSLAAVRAVLAAAEHYAELVARERAAERVSDQLHALERRAAAEAEYASYGRRAG